MRACEAHDQWFTCVEITRIDDVEDRWTINVETAAGLEPLSAATVAFAEATKILPLSGSYRNHQGEGRYWLTVAELRGLMAFALGQDLRFAANVLLTRWRAWSFNCHSPRLLPISELRSND